MDEINGEELNELEAHLYSTLHYEYDPIEEATPQTSEQPVEISNPNKARYWRNPAVLTQKAAAKLSPLNNKQQQNEQLRQVMQEKPKQTTQEPPKQAAQEPPKQAAQEPPKQAAQEPPKQAQHEAPKQVVQEAPKQVLPEAPKQALPESPKQPLQEQTVKEQPKTPRQEQMKKEPPKTPQREQAKKEQSPKQQPQEQRKPPKQAQSKKTQNVKTAGPFGQKERKLAKAAQLRAKKQKSQSVRQKAKKMRPVESIVLDSSSEGEGDDDVIILPTPAPITISVDTSDSDVDEAESGVPVKSVKNEKLKESPIDDAHSSFLAPQNLSDNANRKDVPSSRCTSPCSVQSTDDFIGMQDRKRLKQPNDVTMATADNEDLRSALGVASSKPLPNRVRNIFAKRSPAKKQANSHNSNSRNSKLRENSNSSDAQLAADDATEAGVYSKGTTAVMAAKPTIIRSLSTSSEEEDDAAASDLVNCDKTKKLPRVAAFIANDDGGDRRHRSNSTGISFISRGIALEKNSPLAPTAVRRRASTSICLSDHMSDSAFISTLNNLAQGDNDFVALQQQDEGEINDSDDDSDDANAPTARDIAEKVLNAWEQPSTPPPPAIEDEALPSEALQELDAVFQTIDNMDQSTDQPRRSPVMANSSDSSDSNSSCVVVTDQINSTNELQATTSSNDADAIPSGSGGPPKPTDPIYNVVYNSGSILNGGIGWSEEMRRFYNDSWHGETFSLREIWNCQDPNKKYWKIYTQDRFPKERRNMNLKCTNCLEFGHNRGKCKRPKKAPSCFMCGADDHYEPRCPNTLCLRCGNKTRVFTKSCNACLFQNRSICPLCKVRGHSLDLCPDKWRRYHSTIKANAYPDNNILYNQRKNCCICGRRGHLAESCLSAPRFMEYPTIVSEVKSHQKSYNDQVVKDQSLGIAYNLLYKPENDYFFELANCTKKDKCYGRFLTAVGMGFMFKRKRRLSQQNADDQPSQIKKQLQRYRANPQVAAAGAGAQHQSCDEPEQVQEISISGIHDANETSNGFDADADMSNDNNQSNDVEPIDVDEFNAFNENTNTAEDDYDVVITSNTSDAQMSTEHNTQQQQEGEFKTPTKSTNQAPVDLTAHIDSDSNYSFSEHFDVSNSETQQQQENRDTGEGDREVEQDDQPLPNYIPLTSNDDMTSTDIDTRHVTGISHRFVMTQSDDEHAADSSSALPEYPCEAKIYLTNFHSKYLLSPVGNKFLIELCKTCDVKCRLDCGSVGYVLYLFGVPSNQDKLHRALLHKYRELTDQMNGKRTEENLQKVPKRVDALIRFLRENINQLLNNLGSATDLLKKLQIIEDQQKSLSKAGFKMAERHRRALNMILLGQAGLNNGNRHLDSLLVNLKTLINDFKGEDHAPIDLRNEIDSHWKMIFTPYRHENYPKLLQSYNKLVFKNRIPKLNIDPVLLGHKVLDTTLTAEQRENLQKPDANAKTAKVPDKRPIPPQSSSPPPPAPSMKITTPSAKMPPNKPNRMPSSAHFDEQQSAGRTDSYQTFDTNLGSIFTDIDNTAAVDSQYAPSTSNRNSTVSKGPSMFWSRQSLKYLEECIGLAEFNEELLDKLERIHVKALAGHLSYNDYRGVIRLHGVMIGK